MIFTRLYGSQVYTRIHDVVGAGATFRCPDLIAHEFGIPLYGAEVLFVREHLARLELAGVLSIFGSLTHII